MAVTFLDNIKMFNSIIHDILVSYKKIYKPNKNDKYYLHITPLIVDINTTKEIYDVIYISMYNNTINKIVYGSKTNISVKVINENDKFYSFNIINKSFALLDGYDILKIRKYFDYDKSKTLIADLLNNHIRPGKYIIGSGDLALHIENYIINNILSKYSSFKIIFNNLSAYINDLYDKLIENLSNQEIFFDLVIDANKYDNILNNYSMAMQVLIVSDKTDNDQSKIELFENRLLTKYNNQIINIDLKNLHRSIFTNTKYGISILLKFTEYLELLFLISMLDTIKNI